MPVQVSYPGVYIREVPSGVRTITGVSTSIAMFMSMASRGRLNVPTSVLSFADFERAFGTDTAISEMTDQVRLFFQNGGQRAYIMRIAKDARQAQITVNNEFGANVVIFTAKEAGVIGDSIRIEVDYNTARPEATFNLTVFRETVNTVGDIVFVETESHRDLSMNPSAGRFIKTLLDQGSALVSAKVVGTPPSLIKGYAVSGLLLSAANNLSRINTAITTANPTDNIGKFEISVDGSAFVTVPLQAPVANAVAIQTAIKTALAPTGKTVTVNTSKEIAAGGPAYLVIMSTTDGGSVRLRRAATHDIAGPLRMGVDDGGLEVDGYAVRRPAPTGFFSRLGLLNVEDPAALNALSQFLQENATDIATITVTDSVNGPKSINPTYVGTQMWNGTATTDESLLNGGRNLDAIASAISKETAGIKWTPQRYGYRIVLRPQFGGADTDLSADVTSAPMNTIGDGPTGIFGANPNVARVRLGGYGALGDYVKGDQAGFDGNVPKPKEYDDAFKVVDRDVDLFNLMILPRVLKEPGQTDDDRAALWGPASTFCQQRRAFLLIDPLSDNEQWSDVNEVTARDGGIKDLRAGLVNDHAAIYWPRLLVSANGTTKPIDPSGSIAGLMARTDANRGVWKAPAGLEATIRGVRGVQHMMSDPENGLINPEAVNAIRVFPNGIVSWGARTMDGFDNSPNTDYKYVPVRRLALFIEESLYRGLKFAVFEPNDEPLWAQIRLAAGAFMNNLFRQGAFQGQKASDAYFVKVDSETTTQNDINLGIVNVVVGFAPLKPAEFVIITIQQRAGQVQV